MLKDSNSEISMPASPMEVFSELATLHRWVPYLLKESIKCPGKLTKIPGTKNGDRLSTAHPKDWGTLAEAFYPVEQNRANGVGIVMTHGIKNAGYTLVAFDVDDVQKGFEFPFITYTETSPSGKGIRAFVWVETGVLDGYKDTTNIKYPLCDHMEVYFGSAARFVTVTYDTDTPIPISRLNGEASRLTEMLSKATPGPLVGLAPTDMDGGSCVALEAVQGLSDDHRRLIAGEWEGLDRSAVLYSLLSVLEKSGVIKRDALASILSTPCLWAYCLEKRRGDAVRARSLAEAEVEKVFANRDGFAQFRRALVPAAHTPAPAIGVTAQPWEYDLLSDIPRTELQWLWPGFIPLGKIVVFAGPPDLGKSTVTQAIAAGITSGWQWPATTVRASPSTVIIVQSEDGVGDTVRPHIEAAGGDLSRVVMPRILVGKGKERKTFSLDEHLDALAALIKTTQSKLVIFDPITAFFGIKMDSHKTSDMRAMLAPLKDLAEENGTTIIAVTHHNKSVGVNAMNSITGSNALIAQARSGFTFAKDPDDPERRLMLFSKSNLRSQDGVTGLAYRIVSNVDGIPVIEWESMPVTGITADSVMGQERTYARSADKLDAAQDWLSNYLAEGPKSAVDVTEKAKTFGITIKTLRRARLALGVVSSKATGQGLASGWEWSLPPD